MHTTKVSAKGWVVIPKALRENHGIREGTNIQIVAYGDILALVPLPDDPAKALHGILKKGPSLTADLLAERPGEGAGGRAPRMTLGCSTALRC